MGGRQPAHVVILEDEPSVRTLYEIALSLEGHTVAGAARVEDGLRACEEHPPQVAIVDLFIRERSGLELIRALRQRGAPTRIIAVTGIGDQHDLLEAKDAGADLTLQKPFAMGALVAAVEGLLAN